SADQRGQPIDLLVRKLEELLEKSELGHQLERRGMDSVAAEIAKEVGVLFQNDDFDAGARQEKSEHHAGRTAAGDAALCVDRGGGHRIAPLDQAAGCGACGATPSFFCRLVDDVVYWNTKRFSG